MSDGSLALRAPVGTRAARAAPRATSIPHRIALSAAATVGVLGVGAGAALGPTAAIGAFAAGAAVLVVVAQPRLATALLVGAVPAVSGLARGLPVPGLRLAEVAIVGLGAAALTVGRSPDAPRWRTADWLLVAYAAVTAVQGLLGIARTGLALSIDTAGPLLTPVLWVLLHRSVVVSAADDRTRSRCISWFLLASLPVSASAIVMYHDLLPIGGLLATLTAASDYRDYLLLYEQRATGLFEHWHLLAGYLLPVLLVAAGVLLDRSHAGPRWPAWVAVLPALWAITLTLTFTVYFGMAVGLVAVAWQAGRLREALLWVAGGAVVLGLAAGPLVSQRLDEQFGSAEATGGAVPATVDYRLQVWRAQYLPHLEGLLVSGYGPQLPPDIDWDYPESVYFDLAYKGGVPLNLVFMALQISIVAGAYGAARATGCSSARVAGWTAAALGVALLPMHAVFPYFTTVGLPHAWIALAALARSTDPAREPHQHAQPTCTKGLQP